MSRLDGRAILAILLANIVLGRAELAALRRRHWAPRGLQPPDDSGQPWRRAWPGFIQNDESRAR